MWSNALQVEKHNSRKDGWIILNGEALDVTMLGGSCHGLGIVGLVCCIMTIVCIKVLHPLGRHALLYNKLMHLCRLGLFGGAKNFSLPRVFEQSVLREASPCAQSAIIIITVEVPLGKQHVLPALVEVMLRSCCTGTGEQTETCWTFFGSSKRRACIARFCLFIL